MNRPKRQFYLTNKDLLREIHKSKMSYCWTKSEDFSHYDIIVEDVKELKKKAVMAEAKQNRASRLQKQAHEAEVARWEQGLTGKKTKPRVADFAVDIKSILSRRCCKGNDIQHVPEENRKNKPNQKQISVITKHYANKDKVWEEVARSIGKVE